MTTFKQKAIEALKKMKIPNDYGTNLNGFATRLENKILDDCISRIEAIEDSEMHTILDHLQKKCTNIDTEIQAVINKEFHNLI